MKLNDVLAMDGRDPLVNKRRLFQLPPASIYLNGNSLGALPKEARQRARVVIEAQWGRDLIQSWIKHGWIDLPLRVGEKIASLLGVASGQTICCDSTSINLFKLLSCALQMQQGRNILLTQEDNFPADLYIAESLARTGHDSRCLLQTVSADTLERHLDSTVAVLLLTHVDFRTAAMHDMQRLTRLAHEHGILVIWDLSHSVGAMPLELDNWEVDFAVGCCYKYLNGGPGAPAFIYAARRHHGSIVQPLSGWMGHKAPFSFAPQYDPAPGIAQFLCGTPPILSMSVLDAALDVFAGVDLQTLRRKSVELEELFLRLISGKAELKELQLMSPIDSDRRGSHLAFKHPQAYAICQALISRSVITDFRAPDILRVGFAPLYLSYKNLWDAVNLLSEIMLNQDYRAEQFQRQMKVT